MVALAGRPRPQRRLVRYDERGCGLSDWDVPSFTFEDWVNDLETVVEAAGLDRFPLLGVSQGGAVAIAYAARRPERVSRLILAGAYARGRRSGPAMTPSGRAAALDVDLARVGWGHKDPSFLRVFASQFLPDGTRQEWEEFTAFQQRTTSPANAVRFLEEFARIDVSAIAHRVDCPTLILHSRDDVRVPAAQASELAALIPDSRLVLLDSRNHLLTASELAWAAFLSHVEEFLAELPRPSPACGRPAKEADRAARSTRRAMAGVSSDSGRASRFCTTSVWSATGTEALQARKSLSR